MKYKQMMDLVEAMDFNDLLERLEYFSREFRDDSNDHNRRMLEMYVSMVGIKLIIVKGRKEDLLEHEQVKEFINPIIQNLKGTN